jgi:hypothetical protein
VAPGGQGADKQEDLDDDQDDSHDDPHAILLVFSFPFSAFISFR